MKPQGDKKGRKATIDVGNVKVMCRFRPLNSKELANSSNVCIDFPDKQSVLYKGQGISDTSPNANRFIYDRVFPMSTTQKEIFDEAAKPVIESVLEGFNGTIFAYGQTSSGKTFTMQGADIDDETTKGIIPRIVNHLFQEIEHSPEYIEYRIKVSIVEIYMEKVRDLLDMTRVNLKIREDKSRGVYIEDVTESYVSEEAEVYGLMKIGQTHRAISATNMNEGSSRSHSLFTLTINQNNLSDLSSKTGKFFLVDLAGSEKISKTGAEGRTLDEAKKINASLSALGNVINALTDGKSAHVPYRDSKLTRVLQESLGGNSRTTLIVTCSPSTFNEFETLSTLRFGVRAKNIKNKPKINREMTVAELQLLLEKAEKTIEEKELRIGQLEEFIKGFGKEPPKFTLQAVNQAETKDKVVEKEKGNSEDSDAEAKQDEERASINEEKINTLKQELESEKNSVRMQTEKLNILRKEYALLNAKCITLERENESFIHDLTQANVKVLSMEEMLKEKEDMIEQLEGIKESFSYEIESLKRAKDQLLKEKEKEIENLESRLKMVIKAGSAIRHTKKPSNILGDEMTPEREGAALTPRNRAEKDPRDELLELVKKWVETQADPREALGFDFLSMHKDLLELKNASTSISKNFEYEAKIDVLEKELKTIQDKYSKAVQREQKDNNRGADQESSSTKVGGTEQSEETDRNYQAERELQEERDKNKILEAYLKRTEKNMKQKLNCLETNLEQVSILYQHLVSQRSMLYAENKLLEKKIARKNERVINLEGQLITTKEQLTLLQSKYESLRVMVHQNELGNQLFVGSLEKLDPTIKSITRPETESTAMSESVALNAKILAETSDRSQAALRSRWTSIKTRESYKSFVPLANTAKIVKHIRGGHVNRKSMANSTLLAAISKNEDDFKEGARNDSNVLGLRPSEEN